MSKQKMKIVVLGATGSTGAHVVDAALANGYEVIAYVRTPSAVRSRPGLTIVRGLVEDDVAMRAAFAGSDAIVFCLGLRPSWATLFRENDFQQRMLPNVITAINTAGVKRFVLMSSLGVGESRAKSSLIPRVVFQTLFGGRLFEDKALAEKVLPECRANWTAVYPVTLKKGEADPDWDLVPLAKVRHVQGIPFSPMQLSRERSWN